MPPGLLTLNPSLVL
jgi:hypothetical protein